MLPLASPSPLNKKTPLYTPPVWQEVKRFIIYGRFDGLNDYTKACRTNKYGGNAMKKRNEKEIIEALQGAPPLIKYPVKLKITWYEKNRKRDIDNISFAVKFILDGLVKSGILENDGQKQVCGIEHVFEVDAETPRVDVQIYERMN